MAGDLDLQRREAFAAAYAAHRPRALAAARSILGDTARAEDAVQDAFLRLWRHPERFDPRRGDLDVYVALLARSRAIDIWRSDQAAGRAVDRLRADPPPARTEDPADAAGAQEVNGALRRAVSLLPDAQREAVVLAYWGGLTIAEIARRTSVPLGTAKGRLRLAFEKLTAAVEPLGA